MANEKLFVSASNERVSVSACSATSTLELEQESGSPIRVFVSIGGGSRWCCGADELARIVKAGRAAREAAVDTFVRDGDEDVNDGR